MANRVRVPEIEVLMRRSPRVASPSHAAGPTSPPRPAPSPPPKPAASPTPNEPTTDTPSRNGLPAATERLPPESTAAPRPIATTPSPAKPAATPPAAPATKSTETSSQPPDTPKYGPYLPRKEQFPFVRIERGSLPPVGTAVVLPELHADDTLLASAIADTFQEHAAPARLLIERLVARLGPERTRALYERTRELEATGGVQVSRSKHSERRRRTSGGVFLFLLEREIGWRPFEQASVLAMLTCGVTPGTHATWKKPLPASEIAPPPTRGAAAEAEPASATSPTK